MYREENYLGSVILVRPQFVMAHLPSSQRLRHLTNDETVADQALLGDYVIIEGSDHGFLGKILELELLDSQIQSIHPLSQKPADFHLSAKIETLLSFEKESPQNVARGLSIHPNIGDGIFVCEETFAETFISRFGLKHEGVRSYMDLGYLKNSTKTPVRISQQSFFSRHCAIVGTTGGGKSWTIAKLVEQMKKNPGKAILIDPTGEYEGIVDSDVMSITLAKDAFFHYRHLTIEDLFYLIKPSGSTQLPKLLEAIRSLKAMEIDEYNHLRDYKINGLIRKANKKKAAYEQFYFENIDRIEDGNLKFNIRFLSAQITQECIYDTDKNDPEKYGNRDEEAVSKCVNLTSRTANLLHTEIFQRVFGFNEQVGSKRDLTFIIDKFIQSDKKLLHISFEEIGFEFQAREIIANAIGIYLLKKARSHAFIEEPVVVFLDEAHQFLNKTVVDDYFQGSSLTAFEQIAKECRKYGLFICLATQMPRDIPIGTLSQMGTFVVHRLINANDKSAISEACSSATEHILDFLPILGEGEAILTGVDFPMDITLKIGTPTLKPKSSTPQFDKY